MIREHCVICSSNNLTFSFLLKEFPMIFLPIDNTIENIENDKFINLELYGCQECGCVQLKYLLDPNVLYGIPHNMTYNTPTWKEHHKQLSEFIYNNNKSENIIEIGGYSGVLAKLLNKDINYSILDICDIDPNIENVEFINGNCETYNFKENITVVMSHVFEHLYEPTNFIKNLKRNNVKNIFISIPNMKELIKDKSIPIIHQEHTYFCDYHDIVYLFAKEGYVCSSSFYYLKHSIFFHFVKSDNCSFNYNFDKERINDYYNVYEYNKNMISTINNLDDPFFIVPAGFYGQIIYYFLDEKYRKNLLGFLDNDKSKIGKRLYGTPNFIFKMDEIKNHDSITIIIYNGSYTQEIINQLNSYNSNIKYIILK